MSRKAASAPDRALKGAGQKQRLDVLLVTRGLAATRSRARDLVRRGAVTIEGHPAAKPGQLVSENAVLCVADEAGRYVSRGALKLIAGLDAFGFDPAGRNALDIGASTGGFTQVLLERGAAHVTAIDVGHGQLAEVIASDPRVTGLEGTDARSLDRGTVPGEITAIVADVSFISLTKALPPVLALASPGCWLVALVKPQFEAGREAVGKGGVVRSETARGAAVEKVKAWMSSQSGWTVSGIVESPIKGGDGNMEYLLGAKLND